MQASVTAVFKVSRRLSRKPISLATDAMVFAATFSKSLPEGNRISTFVAFEAFMPASPGYSYTGTAPVRSCRLTEDRRKRTRPGLSTMHREYHQLYAAGT